MRRAGWTSELTAGAAPQVIKDTGGFWAPYITFITFCMGYASIAGCLVSFGAPLAAGSGIPEVKTYLNGVHIKGGALPGLHKL